jgi:hypothetical protein
MKIFTIDRKKYVLQKIVHKNGEFEFKLIPYGKEYKATISEIVEKIKKCVDTEKILEQALSNLVYDEVVKIRDLLRKGTMPKAKKGCYEIGIGKESIPIVG